MNKFWSSATLLLSCLLLLSTQAVAEDYREASLQRAKELGFKVSPSLPLPAGRGMVALRPESEIQLRLDALHALTLWVVAPAEAIDEEVMRKMANEGPISPWLTAKEKMIFQLPRAQAKAEYIDIIGWKMENMWALAWVLGFEVEPETRGQLAGKTAKALVFDFVPSGERKARPLARVRATEDLFYCLHNAVRSAQNGGDTVPNGFSPIAEGGAIHERRHALTWCLSPNVSWDDTDLST